MLEEYIILGLGVVGMLFITTVLIVLNKSGKPLQPMRMSPMVFFNTKKKED